MYIQIGRYQAVQDKHRPHPIPPPPTGGFAICRRINLAVCVSWLPANTPVVSVMPSRRRGHDAMSCDLLPTEVDGPHYQGPVEDVLHDGWDLMVAHPPCTHLAVSGSRHFGQKIADGTQAAALDFVRLLMAAPIERWCIENPVSIISSAIRPPDQIIQPWEYGHGEVKATCLWLQNLPRLRPSHCVEGREERVHRMPWSRSVEGTQPHV